MKNRKIKLALIASGSGTLANAIMEAYRDGLLRSAEPVLLVSAKKNAGCIDYAKKHKVPFVVIDRKISGSLENFNEKLKEVLLEHEIELVFLVGCIIRIFPVPGIKMYNCHPADVKAHGGKGMYGLPVHEHVLGEIKEEIKSGEKKITDRFFTYPTIHEVLPKYDEGQEFLKVSAEIPARIISDYMSGKKSSEESAQELQNVVKYYEWTFWPAAVEGAAAKELSNEKK